MQTYPGLPPVIELNPGREDTPSQQRRGYAQLIVNTSVVIEFVKSFAIITRKEAGDGPYLKKKSLSLKIPNIKFDVSVSVDKMQLLTHTLKIQNEYLS